MKKLLTFCLIIICTGTIIAQETGYDMFSFKYPGKPEWKPMLEYTKKLHEKSTHPKTYPFDYDWEEIGPGYCYGPAFGHWDIIHQVFDAFIYNKQHGLEQLYNDVKNQESSGLVPGVFFMPGGKSGREEARWGKILCSHAPVWVVAVDDYIQLTGNDTILRTFYPALIRQITWFENARKVIPEGFYYKDIVNKKWESGMDDGIRYDNDVVGIKKWACIDATSHVFMLYKYAEKWSLKLNLDGVHFKNRKTELEHFINDSLYYAPDKMYYDAWVINDISFRKLVFENFWPLITGAIPKERADYLIDNYLLNKSYFLTPHPIPTVSVSEPKFELRMLRGPSWNSLTYWIVRGCIGYGRKDAAKIILEQALDKTAEQFDKTGTIWEFYHPFGGDQMDLKRKPYTEYNTPCKDYLGHNPLLAMANLYDQIIKSEK